MSKEREPLYICENCDKGTDAGYFDKETGQTLCHNCFNERQRSFKDQRIADLEAKLAECEKKLIKYIDNATQDYSDNRKEILQLKQQLSDRETKWAIWNKKDRVEFAIKELEKVKEYADIDFRKNCYINAVELDKFIDNQIKQLNASNSMPLEDKGE